MDDEREKIRKKLRDEKKKKRGCYETKIDILNPRLSRLGSKMGQN